MASRRDQLHSYQFLVQRAVSAFVMREPNPTQSPLRRGIGAAFGGVMAVVLIAAGFGVYGLLTKVGDNNWRVDGAVVVERETGASFVYLDGRLHPTLNYASALLIAGRPGQKAFRISTRSLQRVPRGLTLGIVGAPDSLPPAKSRVRLPWTICSVGGTDAAGKPSATVGLVAGAAPAGPRPLGDGGLLVRDQTTGTSHLIWHSHRYEFRDPVSVIPALFGAVAAPLPVGTAWLNTLPAGVSIGPLEIPNRGRPSAAVPNRKVGDLLEATTGSAPAQYLVFDDGIAPITPLQRAILLAQFPLQPAQIDLSAANAIRRSTRLDGPTGEFAAPQTAPVLVQPGAPTQPVCAATRDARNEPEVSLGGTVEGLATGVPTGSRSADGTALADQVTVPSGRVAVVRVLGSPNATGGAFYIITDTGRRYPVARPEVLAVLGYSPSSVVDVPATLVSRIPAGPALDPGAAIVPVAPGTPQTPASNPTASR